MWHALHTSAFYSQQNTPTSLLLSFRPTYQRQALMNAISHFLSFSSICTSHPHSAIFCPCNSIILPHVSVSLPPQFLFPVPCPTIFLSNSLTLPLSSWRPKSHDVYCYRYLHDRLSTLKVLCKIWCENSVQTLQSSRIFWIILHNNFIQQVHIKWLIDLTSEGAPPQVCSMNCYATT